MPKREQRLDGNTRRNPYEKEKTFDSKFSDTVIPAFQRIVWD